MPKSERVLEMLKFIIDYPHLNAQDLAAACNISERGVYRYLNTLKAAGIPVVWSEDGYKLADNGICSLNGGMDLRDEEDLRTVRTLMVLGMQGAPQDLVTRGQRLVAEMFDIRYPYWQRPPISIRKRAGDGRCSSGGHLTIGHCSKPGIISPVIATESISVNLLGLIFSTCVRITPDGTVEPDLAETWKLSDDKKSIALRLRRDARFSDGTPVTAQHVKSTYDAVLNPCLKSPVAERCRSVQAVNVENDTSCTISLKHPLTVDSWRKINLGITKHPGPPYYNFDNRRRTDLVVGSGPFKVIEWTDDNTIILGRNEYYNAGVRPALETVSFRYFGNVVSALSAINNDSIDLAIDLTPSDMIFLGNRRFKIYTIPDYTYYALFFNLHSQLSAQRDLRLAIDHAVDKKAILDRQLSGFGDLCTGPFHPKTSACNPDITRREYSKADAARLLQKAGWEHLSGLFKRGQDWLKLRIGVLGDKPSLPNIALAIKAQLAHAGILSEIRRGDSLTALRRDCDAILARVNANGSPSSAERLWHSKYTQSNISHYSNARVDALFEKAKETWNIEAANSIYRTIHKTIYGDCPAVFVATGCSVVGSRYVIQDELPCHAQLLDSLRHWRFADTAGPRLSVMQS